MNETTPCAGCSAAIDPRDTSRRTWCDRCVWIAPDIHAIERAARLLQRYGLSSDSPIPEGLQAIRDQLRTGAGPARDIAKGAEDRFDRRERNRHRRTATQLLDELAPLTSAGDGPWWEIAAALFGRHLDRDLLHEHLDDFAATTYDDDARSAEDLFAAAAAYLEAKLPKVGHVIAFPHARAGAGPRNVPPAS